MDLALAGRTAVITGAASGIGRATAIAMADEGVAVIAIDQDKDGLIAAAAELAPAPAGAHVAIAADLSCAAGVELAMTDALASAGGAIDIFVSNAGACQWRALGELTDEDWQQTLDLNFAATRRSVPFLLPGLRARRGAIVITASDLAKQPEPNPVDYSVSKAALVAYMKALALTAAPQVRVNAVAPGPIWTGLWSRPGGIADNLARLHGLDRESAIAHELSLRQLPLQRMGEPSEVAAVITFLASDRASFVTGSVWDVGGGSNRGLF